MTEIILSARERAQLQDLMVRTSDARILRRAYALLWSDEGKSVHEIAAQLKISRQTVYNWLERFHERADDDLITRLSDAQRSGRPKTALGIIDPLIEAIIDRDPREQGYRATVWTAPLLMSYLANVHHLTVSCQSVRLAIARLRFRWKRPRHTLALRSATWRQAKGG
jgi:transposase